MAVLPVLSHALWSLQQDNRGLTRSLTLRSRRKRPQKSRQGHQRLARRMIDRDKELAGGAGAAARAAPSSWAHPKTSDFSRSFVNKTPEGCDQLWQSH